MPVIPTLRKLREEACEFKISLSYIVRACPKKKKTCIQTHIHSKITHNSYNMEKIQKSIHRWVNKI
jgi:hypothetical protein